MIATKLKRLALLSATACALISPVVTQAGDINGAGCMTERVRANTTDVYRIQFVPGRPAWVSIRGDGDTDLDLQIIDSTGRTVCVALGRSDREQCEWLANAAGETQVRVINHGSVFNVYRFCTN